MKISNRAHISNFTLKGVVLIWLEVKTQRAIQFIFILKESQEFGLKMDFQETNLWMKHRYFFSSEIEKAAEKLIRTAIIVVSKRKLRIHWILLFFLAAFCFRAPHIQFSFSLVNNLNSTTQLINNSFPKFILIFRRLWKRMRRCVECRMENMNACIQFRFPAISLGIYFRRIFSS